MVALYSIALSPKAPYKPPFYAHCLTTPPNKLISKDSAQVTTPKLNKE